MLWLSIRIALWRNYQFFIVLISKPDFTRYGEITNFYYFYYFNITSRELLRTKVTPDFHVTYSKSGGNLGLVSK